MTIANLTALANDSGGVLYVIGVMLFVELTIIIERAWFLRRMARSSRAALEQIDELKTLSNASLSACADQFAGLPGAAVVAAASRLVVGNRSREDLDASIQEVIMREVPRVDRLLWLLDTIVTLAPLLGLFGTIVGMFNAFQVLSNPGNAPAQVTGGVAQALIATASGLFVAMVGLVAFNGLHNRVRTAVHQLETLKAALVNRLASGSHGSHDQAKKAMEGQRAAGEVALRGV
jgi:biopolymer transport protein ExbB